MTFLINGCRMSVLTLCRHTFAPQGLRYLYQRPQNAPAHLPARRNSLIMAGQSEPDRNPTGVHVCQSQQSDI